MWKATSLRSAFGTQCLAKMKSSPSCGFGSSLREAGLKVPRRLGGPELLTSASSNKTLILFTVQTYISRDADRALCRAQGGNNSQGPIYKLLVSSMRPAPVPCYISRCAWNLPLRVYMCCSLRWASRACQRERPRQSWASGLPSAPALRCSGMCLGLARTN